MTEAKRRWFRVRMKEGRGFHSFGEQPGFSYGPGDVFIVSEKIAASLVRGRAAEIVEVIEADADSKPGGSIE